MSHYEGCSPYGLAVAILISFFVGREDSPEPVQVRTSESKRFLKFETLGSLDVDRFTSSGLALCAFLCRRQ